MTAGPHSSATKCSIRGCPGEYAQKAVTHTVRHKGRLIVIDHVPAEVCDICGDVLFDPQTVRNIERLLAGAREPQDTAPVYEYA